MAERFCNMKSLYFFAARVVLAVAIVVVAIAACCASVDEPGEETTPVTVDRIVVFMIPGVSWEEIAAQPDLFLHELAGRGSSGVMNVRTYGGYDTLKCFLSLGAGNRANADYYAGTFYGAEEDIGGAEAGEVYMMYNGRAVRPGSVLYVDVESIIEANKGLGYDIYPGALGDSLKYRDYVTAVLGNGDGLTGRFRVMMRDFAGVAMDSLGVVGQGRVDTGLLEESAGGFFSRRADPDIMVREFKKYYGKSNFLVVDYGDIFRAENTERYKSEEESAAAVSEALARTDAFIRRCAGIVDPGRTILIVLSGTPSENDRDYLAPVIIAGPGFEPGTPLTSPTTHRTGIVANTDFYPTVAAVFGFQPDNPNSGTVMKSSGRDGADIREFIFLNRRSYNVDVYFRKIGVHGFIIAQALLCLICVLVILAAEKVKQVVIDRLMLLVLAVSFFPLSSYLVTFLVHRELNTVTFMLGAVMLCGGGAAGAVSVFRTARARICLVSAVTALYLMLDVATGAHGCMNSVFGYSPIIGGRYYGIGNESMAILVASSAIAATTLAGGIEDKRRRIAAFGVVAVLVVTVTGFPALGANTGGTIAAVAAFGYIILKLLGRKIGVAEVVAIAAALALLLGVYVALDYFSPAEEKTHLGRALGQIGTGGIRQVFLIASRKLSMNFSILQRYSVYVVLMVLIIIVNLYWIEKVRGIYMKVMRSNPYFHLGIKGAFVGGIVGFCVNDSGVVIPCLIVSYIALCTICMCLEKAGETGRRMNTG